MHAARVRRDDGHADRKLTDRTSRTTPSGGRHGRIPPVAPPPATGRAFSVHPPGAALHVRGRDRHRLQHPHDHPPARGDAGRQGPARRRRARGRAGGIRDLPDFDPSDFRSFAVRLDPRENLLPIDRFEETLVLVVEGSLTIVWCEPIRVTSELGEGDTRVYESPVRRGTGGRRDGRHPPRDREPQPDSAGVGRAGAAVGFRADRHGRSTSRSSSPLQSSPLNK